MSSVGDIAAGLKANLDTLDVNVSKYPRSNPVGVLIHLWPEAVTYHRAMQMGLSETEWSVQLVWPYNDDAGTASQMYDYLDPSGDRSVRQALESDKTLGGACERLQVELAPGIQVGTTQDNQPRLTATWTVRVYLNGGQ